MNKTIVKEAVKKENALQNDDILLPGGLGYVKHDRGKYSMVSQITSAFIGNDGATTLTLQPVGFVFPNDLDKIQPEQINGNLTIKFPESQ